MPPRTNFAFPKIPWWGWAVSAGVFLLLFRKQAASGLSTAYSAAKAQAFKLSLPKDGRPLAPIFLQVGEEKGIAPALLAALCERETYYGKYLAADGTGDYGHGRGLMQIDDRSFADWLAKNNWKDPLVNVRKGADVLLGKKAYLAKNTPLTGDALWKAAIAAYNTGEGNVRRSVTSGKNVDSTTTGGNYSTDVLAKAARIEQTLLDTSVAGLDDDATRYLGAIGPRYAFVESVGRTVDIEPEAQNGVGWFVPVGGLSRSI